MKIILRQSISTLGSIGEVVAVKDGYARNYLLPRGLAYVATKSNMNVLGEEKKRLQVRMNKELKDAEKIAQELEKHENAITIQMPVGEEDKLFGTVTKEMISEKLAERGFAIDKRKIEIEEPIKVLGIYTVTIRLHTDVSGKVKVWVVRQQ
ncbi:MAG: 50S ribosomal protein L9 [Ignavibacteria bacterium]|jgi:large subunit ribosomal protein L9|nr:50S ribosomal protein L9 [Ignavibacteria bacterium]